MIWMAHAFQLIHSFRVKIRSSRLGHVFQHYFAEAAAGGVQ